MAEISKTRLNLEKAQIMILCGEEGMEFLVRIFKGFGVRQPYRCRNAEAARLACKETDFDLIVCDGSLPDGEAYDFVAELRRSDLEPNRFCPVMMIQGHTPLDLIERARDCGSNFVLAKPVTPRLLLERILWIAKEGRPFIELDGYVGPDRRFRSERGVGRNRRRLDREGPINRPAINAKDALI